MSPDSYMFQTVIIINCAYCWRIYVTGRNVKYNKSLVLTLQSNMIFHASDLKRKGKVTSLTLYLSHSVTTFVTNNNEWRKRSVTSSIRQYLWDWACSSIGLASLCYRSSVVSHLLHVTFDSAVDCLSVLATVLISTSENLRPFLVSSENWRTNWTWYYLRCG
jgi:hypothetical protein